MRSRLVAATALALFVAVALTGWVGTAQPEGAALEAPRPLRSGDAGGYDVTLHGDWDYDGHSEDQAFPGFSFEVDPLDSVPAADGRWVDAVPIRVQAETYDAGWVSETVRVWVLDGHIVAQEGGHATQSEGHAETRRVVDYHTVSDCILNGPWVQDHDPAGWVLPVPCRTPAGIGLPGGAVVEVVGTERIGPVSSLHLRAGGVSWWYAADVPVPLRMELHDGDRAAVFELTSFQPGPGDGPTGSAIMAPPVVMATTSITGPSEAGIGHFPLAEAFEAARQSTAWTDLADWLDAHDAHVFAATHDVAADAWDLHLSDGDEGFSFRASPNDAVFALLGEAYRFERIDGPDPTQAPPMPGRLPTIASLQERWKVYAGRGDANTWGFEMARGEEGPIVSITVGRDAHHDDLVEGTSRHASFLRVDATGQALRYEEYYDGPEGQSPAPTPAAPYRPTAMAAIPRSWDMPSPAEQTGIGLVALAAGLLYTSWPWLKGALALFSRVQPHELTRHPQRQAIMDAVTAEPGIHFRAMCTRLDANAGTVRHHLRKLLQGGLLLERASAGYTCYYAANGTSRAVVDAGPVLRADGARNLLREIQRAPGSSAQDLAAAAGISPGTASYHLKRLQAVGLVQGERDGRRLRLFLTQNGAQAVA